jgi:hypothetical protein
VISQKNRNTYILYYWESLKVDMSKILLSDTKNPEGAKEVSIRVFAIKDQLREYYIRLYCEYCRLIFVLKFIEWRLHKLIYNKKPIRFDWSDELPRIAEKIDNLEYQLFGGLNPTAKEILMKNGGYTKSTL